ncbi:MAG: trigger factor [Alphaproteobacteria bacterium]|jgi:trigger factor|nr:trigger factor [Alphaproteobacteria bacterium]MDP6623532.1 trigger factor [Alphaproteobacteria bacterium]|tara:strand:+ start:331 stop:1863 length:1533 start_codon:yes stop_codon:yes gene_type:complete
MQVTQTSADGLKREFAVVVEAAEIETKIAARLEQLATTTQMPGFRPGKVPVGLMRQKYGDAVTGEVLEDTVNLGTQQAMSENELKPALQPQIEITKFEPGSDLVYTIAVEVLPEIEASDFSKLKLERLKAEPSEEEVTAAIDRLAQAQRVYTEEAGRVAADGDATVIDFAGSIDGELFEGGSGEDHELVLGSQSFIPGFEDQLVGTKAGDEISVKVDFPDDYPAEHLKGKAAVFETTVKAVKVCEEMALDDAFAQRLGLENLEGLQKAMRDQIGNDYDGASRERLKRSLLDALAGSHDFEVPPGMVSAELDAIWQAFGEQTAEAAQQGQSPEEADEVPSEDEIKERYGTVAERRVRLGLLLSEVGQRNNIEVHPEEVNQAIAAQARRFPGQERQVIEYFQKDAQAQAQLRAPIFEDKVIDFILELAEVEDRLVPVEELMREPEDELAAGIDGDEKEKKPAKKSAKKSAKAKAEAEDEAASEAKSKTKPKAKAKPKPKTKAKTKDETAAQD